MSSVLNNFVDIFRSGRDVPSEDAEPLFDAMISEADEPSLVELFQAWDSKGITTDEIYDIAQVMRSRCTRISSKHERFVDVVGTGGSKVKTFNVSTAAAFVVAGAGVPVAKHGNKAATSSTGSADALSALGVEPAADPATAQRCLNDIGICFMFAPNFHRLSPTLAKVRRGLGFPTIFNCVGPLCNPAGAPHQLIGVWSREFLPKMASALSRLGTTKSWIVHGSDGLDEITLSGPTFIAEVENGSVREFEISPEDFGLERQPIDAIRATTSEASAAIIGDVLAGRRKGTPEEGVVIMNAAAAIRLNGVDDTAAAIESIRSGSAISKLEQLAEAVNKR